MSVTINNQPLSSLSTKELIALYNKHAEKPVKKFSSRTVAIQRTTAILRDVKPLPTRGESPVQTAHRKLAKVKPLRQSTVWVYKTNRPTAPQQYRSVLAAFIELKLPVPKHKPFRAMLKQKKEASFQSYTFTTVAPPNYTAQKEM